MLADRLFEVREEANAARDWHRTRWGGRLSAKKFRWHRKRARPELYVPDLTSAAGASHEEQEENPNGPM
eukprot:16211-Eustigmatos_ZCMA.PRE.1